MKAELIQHLFQNRSLDFVILDYQYLVNIFFVLNSFKRLDQNIFIQRFAEEVVIVGILDPQPVELRVVSSHYQNRSFLNFEILFMFPDFFNGFDAIHNRHGNVHQDGVIVIVLQFKHVDGLL